MTTILTDLVTDEELTAAFDHVMAAPLNDGPVHLLCARPKPNARTYPQSLTLTRAHGVIGDFQMSQPWLELPDGSPDPQIQVSVLPFRVLDLCWRNRDNPRATHPGDNIVTDMNLSYANVPTGSLLQAGTAVLRVSEEPNDGCVKWKVRLGKPAYTWIRAPAHAGLRLRGLFCSVEQDGVVTIDDKIKKL